MRFELGLEKPDPRRATSSAMVIGSAYNAGGLVPLCPYMILGNASAALRFLAQFGVTKAWHAWEALNAMG